MKLKTNWLGVALVFGWSICLNFIVQIASPGLPSFAYDYGLWGFAGSSLGLFGSSWLITRLIQSLNPADTSGRHYRRWAVTAAVFAGLMYLGNNPS